MIDPVPMSLSAKKTPTTDEKISGPDVPNGIRIALVKAGDKKNAKKKKKTFINNFQSP